MTNRQGSAPSQDNGTGEVRSCPDPKDYWSGFCRGTPIHGVKYLVETDRPLYERLWWVAVLVISLYYATAYSLELWFRLTVKPTDYTIQTVSKYEEIEKIPFPALTFCDNMKPTDKGSETMSFLCGQEYETLSGEGTGHADLKVLQNMKSFFNSTCKINYYIEDFKNNTFSCEKMFTKILTQHGVCYSFNMLETSDIFKAGVVNYYSHHHRSSDWLPGKGYREGAALVEGSFPMRAISSAITFQIHIGTSQGTFCPDDKPGIKLAVHNPAEMPLIGHRDSLWVPAKDEEKEEKEAEYMDLESGKEYYLDADPDFTWTNKLLRYIPPSERHCYFHGEKHLAYYKFYTQTNCENECLINITIEECGCVDFYMPHSNDTVLCSTDKLICMMDAMDWWKKRGMRLCACYPPCKHLKYNTDLYYKRSSGSNEMKNSTSVILTVYITDSHYVSIERKKLQTPYYLVDFIANCGGVFGLFCGMSIVSLVELGYYGSLRLISDICRRRKKAKRLTSEE